MGSQWTLSLPKSVNCDIGCLGPLVTDVSLRLCRCGRLASWHGVRRHLARTVLYDGPLANHLLQPPLHRAHRRHVGAETMAVLTAVPRRWTTSNILASSSSGGQAVPIKIDQLVNFIRKISGWNSKPSPKDSMQTGFFV
jgi:hypothetical protein